MQLPKIASTLIGPLCSVPLPMVENGSTHSEFGARLAEAMRRAGLSISDVAAALRVTYEMARRYHEGQAMPRPDKIRKLASLLGLSPGQLLYGVPPEAAGLAPMPTLAPEEAQLLDTYRALPDYGKKALRARAAELLEHFGKPSASNPFGKGGTQ